ncbi:hypothetical protein BKA63DRAFT_485096 [Paraphoma chrysanthemicola]|nr:hypothetical protein BKA63DRAFT_485096 [Paraphoma chrysanthemicola]
MSASWLLIVDARVGDASWPRTMDEDARGAPVGRKGESEGGGVEMLLPLWHGRGGGRHGSGRVCWRRRGGDGLALLRMGVVLLAGGLRAVDKDGNGEGRRGSGCRHSQREERSSQGHRRSGQDGRGEASATSRMGEAPEQHHTALSRQLRCTGARAKHELGDDKGTNRSRLLVAARDTWRHAARRPHGNNALGLHASTWLPCMGSSTKAETVALEAAPCLPVRHCADTTPHADTGTNRDTALGSTTMMPSPRWLVAAAETCSDTGSTAAAASCAASAFRHGSLRRSSHHARPQRHPKKQKRGLHMLFVASSPSTATGVHAACPSQSIDLYLHGVEDRQASFALAHTAAPRASDSQVHKLHHRLLNHGQTRSRVTLRWQQESTRRGRTGWTRRCAVFARLLPIATIPFRGTLTQNGEARNIAADAAETWNARGRLSCTCHVSQPGDRRGVPPFHVCNPTPRRALVGHSMRDIRLVQVPLGCGRGIPPHWFLKPPSCPSPLVTAAFRFISTRHHVRARHWMFSQHAWISSDAL